MARAGSPSASFNALIEGMVAVDCEPEAIEGANIELSKESLDTNGFGLSDRHLSPVGETCTTRLICAFDDLVYAEVEIGVVSRPCIQLTESE